MKEKKHGFRRILAILLCVMLFASNQSLTAFADEGTATPSNRGENAGEIIIDSNLEYVLPGSTSVPMSEILTALGLSGEVTAVEISDESLFSASNESGVWIVTAHQAFSSTEWMKVTVSDVVYEITVTYDGAITSWAELQTSLTAGGDVYLTQDLTAGADDAALIVPSGVTVTLDLNGFTLDRGLAGAEENGSVIINNGTLIINDSSSGMTGTITGGYTDGAGGGINTDSGTLVMNGGTITENTAENNNFDDGNCKGGGVYVNNGSFTMNGGTICENVSSGNGGGVYVLQGGTFTVNGDASVRDNMKKYRNGGNMVPTTRVDNVFLASKAVISVGDSFTGSVAVRMDKNGVFTSGLYGTDSSCFTSDKDGFAVGIIDGEAAVLQLYSVTAEDGMTGGTVTADKSEAVAGETVTVTVTPETEYELKTLTYTPADTGEPVTVSLSSEPDAGTGSYIATFDMPAANVTVNAAFRSTAPSEWSQLVAAFSEGGVVTLTQDVAAQEGDGRLVVPSGKTVTLDLNGHTLGPSNYFNEVIYIGGGTLILTGDGTITGGNENLYGIYAERSGTFTMNGGTITGVNQDGISLNSSSSSTMNGGAIRNCPKFGVDILNSSFTLNGGEITGSGFIGVDVDSSEGNFTLNGGKISGSSRFDVYVDSNNFHLSGGTVSGTILLRQGSRIVIDSQLPPDACYNIDMETIDRFTYGLNGKGDLSNFRCADYLFTVALDERGEAMLVRSGTVAPYVECSWDGEKVVSKLTSRNNGQWQTFPDDANITSGWYYLDHNVTKNNRIVSITGDVNLILGDGSKLDVKGLYVPEGSTLTIYGQSAGTGKIYSHPSGGAAIGGYSEHNNGNIVIHSGTVEANGYDHCAGIGSNDGCTGGFITIYGGTVTANGGSDGAGIGGGRSRSGGDITIYGGDITAKGGGSNGAGIGGGQHGDGGTINIYGGTVTTSDSPSENGAGIGGGDSAAGGNITIYGGTITTYSRDGAGIGGGDDGDGGSITIHGGTITSTKVNQGQGARIGGGCDGAPGTITINSGSITTEGGSGAGIGGGKGNKDGGCVTINGGVINAGGDYGIGSGEDGADVAVTLGYTDATKAAISITSSSYNGTVKLDQPFSRHSGSGEIRDALFMAGDVSDNSRLGGGKLKAWDGNITSWQELQGILDDVRDGTTIRLTQDISAVRGVDSKLNLGEGKNVILDLNGYTLSRALTDCSPEENGHVITNYGTLSITDSSADHSGKITGGNSTDQCGAIWNWDTLTLEGVTVSGNCAGLKAGAIWNWGTLTLEGAEISGNTSGQEAGGIFNEPYAVVNLINAEITGNTSGLSGGGIYNKGILNISGASVISGNSAPDGSNVYMTDYGPALQVTGGLDQDCLIGVTIERKGDFANGLFTNGLPGRGTAANFFSDDSSFAVSIHDDGEAYLDSAVTVTFDSDGGSEVESQTVITGRKAVRPEDPAKDGFTFKDWYRVTDADTGTLAGTAFDFENTAVNESITLKAVWEESSEDTVIIKSANVEFQGKIRLQFAFSFPESVLADEGAYVTFEKAGTITKKLVSEGTAGADSVSFIIPVPAPEYADDIIVRVYDGEDNPLTFKTASGTDCTADGFVYSVKQYAQNKAESGSTEQMCALAKALDSYGTAAQIYFQYGDYSSLSVDTAVTAVTLEDLVPYALATSGTRPAGVTGARIEVEFDTDNTLRITFKTDGSKALDDYTFLLDGVETVPKKSGKNGYLLVKNIAAPNLDTAHSFTVTDGQETYTVTASALSYAYTSVKNGDSARQNLGKALYLYNQAADAYFGR